MELNQVVKERRSVRSYEADRKVSRAMIEEMLWAAQMAPSWKNSQTARYHVVMSEELRERICKESLPEFNRKNCDGASVLIVSTFVKSRAGFDREGNPVNEVGDGWGYYDLGLSNENLILKAKDMGLDTLIMGIRDAKALRDLLHIPDEQLIVSVIAVGYSTAKPEAPKRKALEQIAFFC